MSEVAEVDGLGMCWNMKACIERACKIQDMHYKLHNLSKWREKSLVCMMS